MGGRLELAAVPVRSETRGGDENRGPRTCASSAAKSVPLLSTCAARGGCVLEVDLVLPKLPRPDGRAKAQSRSKRAAAVLLERAEGALTQRGVRVVKSARRGEIQEEPQCLA